MSGSERLEPIFSAKKGNIPFARLPLYYCVQLPLPTTTTPHTMTPYTTTTTPHTTTTTPHITTTTPQPTQMMTITKGARRVAPGFFLP